MQTCFRQMSIFALNGLLPPVDSSKTRVLRLLLVALFVCIRRNFDELAGSAEVDAPSRVLRIGHPVTNQIAEISAVYFRAGYTPTGYPTQARFDAVLLLKRSCATKRPAVQR